MPHPTDTQAAPPKPHIDPVRAARRRILQARAAAGAMFFLNGMCIANWLTRIPVVRQRLNLDDRELGLVLLATAIGSVVAMRLSKHLLSRYGSKDLNVWSGCAFAVLLIGPGLAPTAWLLSVALFFVGGASGLMGVCMNTQAVQLERSSGKAILSSFHGLFSLGCMIGAGMGSTASNYDIHLPVHLACVAAFAIPCLLLAGHFLLMDSEGRHEHKSTLTLTRPVVVLAILVFCSSIGEGAMADWTGVYLHDYLHTTLTVAALGYSVFATAMLVGRFSGDWLAARLSDARVLKIGGVLVMIGLGGGLLVNSSIAMLIGIAFVGAGLSTVVPIAFRAAGRLPNVPTSAALATLASLGYGGFLVGPPIIGMVSHATSLRWGLGVVAVLGAPLALLSATVARAQRIEDASSVASTQQTTH